MRLIAVMAALLFVAGCTSGNDADSGATQTPPASTSPSAPVSPSAAVTQVDFRLYRSSEDAALHFRSPSGNIVCDLGSESDADFLSCAILKHDWKAPCSDRQIVEAEIGQSDTELPHLRCGDVAPDPTARVLPYNHAIAGINIECISTMEGMTCEDTNPPHVRFFLSRAAYRLS